MAYRSGDAPPDVEHDFDAWASVSAQLLPLSEPERKALVQQFGIAQAWNAADGAWSIALSADMLEGRLERMNRYGEICAGVLAAWRQVDEAGATPAEPPHAGAEELSPAATSEATDPADTRQPIPQGLVEPKVPAGVTPQLPTPGRSSGARLDLGAVRQSLHAAEDAVGWSVEHYARFCAELQRQPGPTEALWAARGFEWPQARHYVVGVWNERLSADPELKRRWSELVAEYLAE